MTICVATMARWHYDPDGKDIGPCIVMASDRMITDEGLGIEYEPYQFKGVALTSRIVMLVAGDTSVHSEAVRPLLTDLKKTPEDNVDVVASMYAKRVREIISKRAAHKYLSPLGLDSESFIKRQKEMDPNLVMELSNKILSESISAEAIIAGCSDTEAQIYSIDNAGEVHCHTDIGFAAIGIGGIHAAGQLMNYSYTNMQPFWSSVALTYSAKRRAEIAPGVGKSTDMVFITRVGLTKIEEETLQYITKLFAENEKRKRKIDVKTVDKLLTFARSKTLMKEETQSLLPTTHDPSTPPP